MAQPSDTLLGTAMVLTTLLSLVLVGQTTPTLDDLVTVGPKQMWCRGIEARHAGKILYAVDSHGPFTIMLVNERGYRAVVATKDYRAIRRSDVIQMKSVSAASCHSSAMISPGSTVFLIWNDTGQTNQIRFRCWALGY
jgi:hypothetical protein